MSSSLPALGSSRRRERILLGLDQAFGISTVREAERRKDKVSSSNQEVTMSTKEPYYSDLPSHLWEALKSASEEKSLQSEDVLPSTSSVEDVLQRLLLRNSKDLQLRGKTVSMDNARGQNEQLRSRASRQQTRRCTRLSVRTSNLGNSLISGNGVESSDVKRKPRDVASLDSYEGLKSAWQGYAQDLLTLCQENDMRTKGGMSPIYPAQSRQNILPCSSSLKRGPKKSLERSLAMADFSGCQIKILDSKCVSEVGFEGLVLHESRGALHILPLPRNHRSSQLCHASKRLRIIPKKGRRFQADVLTSSGRCTVIWHGNGLIDRERLTAFRASMPNRCRGLERESGRMLRNTCVDS